ncbi:MAG: Ku protein [Acidobacteriaceae bacterium]|nr:Ku protein [Acidobacteriaceae bacterium]MBV9779662.1 Ku protein [Acidobacteriaceae bacterium]
MAITVWRGFITFGLISIPVRLFRAARPERVSFRRLYRAEPDKDGPNRRSLVAREQPQERMAPAKQQTESITSSRPSRFEARPAPEPILAPVEQASVRKGTGEVVSRQSLVKGYEYEKDRFVVVEPEELKSIAPKTATEMEIQEFVQLAEIDPVYFETSYYVKPEEAGEKAYALLYRALQQSGLVAIAKFAMHNREHVVVVRAAKTGIIAHTMYFASEVRADEEYRADTRLVTPKELELAGALIHSLAAPFEPEKYRDTYREKVESMIASKVQGRPVETVEAPKHAAVVDIADALRRSLANLKKPAASDERLRTANEMPKRTATKKVRGAGQK